MTARPVTRPVVEVRQRAPEWIVLVDGVHVATGRKLECYTIAAQLEDAPGEAALWREYLRDTDSGL